MTKITTIDNFYELVQKGIQAWVEAGKLVAEQLEQDPDFADKVHERHPEISTDTVYAFDRIGRKELHPKLVISDCPGAVRLRKLPYTIQEKYVEDTVKLLIRKDKGWENINVSVFNLTSDQARQVFSETHVRNDAEQRAWVEDKQAKAIVPMDEPYRVTGRKLIVMQPCQLTAKQLATLLAQME